MLEQGYISRVRVRPTARASRSRRARAPPPREENAAPVLHHLGASSRSSTSSAAASGAGASRAGCEIRTTLDLELQEAAEQRRQRSGWPAGGGPRASLVAIDNRTGEVRAMVGGDDYDDAAVQPRHPGPAPAGLGVQAVRARRGADGGHLARARPGSRSKKIFDVPEQRRRGEVRRQQLRGRLRRHQRRSRRDARLRQRGLRRRSASRSAPKKIARAGAADGHPHAGLRQLRDDARRPQAGRHAAGHGARLRDVRHRRQARLRDAQPRRAAQGPTGGPARSGSRRSAAATATTSTASSCRAASARDARRRCSPPRVAEQVTDPAQDRRHSTARATRARSPTVVAAGKTGTTENYGDAWFVGLHER